MLFICIHDQRKYAHDSFSGVNYTKYMEIVFLKECTDYNSSLKIEREKLQKICEEIHKGEQFFHI